MRSPSIRCFPIPENISNWLESDSNRNMPRGALTLHDLPSGGEARDRKGKNIETEFVFPRSK